MIWVHRIQEPSFPRDLLHAGGTEMLGKALEEEEEYFTCACTDFLKEQGDYKYRKKLKAIFVLRNHVFNSLSIPTVTFE